jgi:glycosyltransferase involved in cell wall biosynthesis
MKNVFYFHHLNVIGGVENMFYELAKKYKDWDIIIYYGAGDTAQINRLKKFVKVKKYKTGETIECEKVFFNYQAPIIDKVKAKEYYMIIHADYKAQGIQPPRVPSYVNFIGVSQAVCDSFTELTGKPCKLCYNPITIDPPIKTLRLISATRLTKEKGRARMVQLVEALEKAHIPFIWEVYTNSKDIIRNPNVIYKQPTLEINGKIKEADYLVQLSDSESYCYTMIEALMLGTPIIVTPWNCLQELGVTEEHGFILPFDMKNIPIQEIYNKQFNFQYTPPLDCWHTILAPGPSIYQQELNTLYKVEALNFYQEENIRDVELNRIPKCGEQWETSKERLDILLGDNQYHRPIVKLIGTRKKDESI